MVTWLVVGGLDNGLLVREEAAGPGGLCLASMEPIKNPMAGTVGCSVEGILRKGQTLARAPKNLPGLNHPGKTIEQYGLDQDTNTVDRFELDSSIPQHSTSSLQIHKFQYGT